jgi:integrase/recombinase XerD
MPGGNKKRPRPSIADGDPRSMATLLAAFLERLRVKNYAASTIEDHDINLRHFIAWCVERAITRASDVTKPMIDRYQRVLYYYRKPDGRPLSFQSQHLKLSSVKLFFRWLTRENHILYNPASEIELPRVERRLPRYVLTANEADRVLSQPDITTPFGIRDRAMLEILYSTGIRRAELVHLTIYDLDAERGTIMVRQGKGKKDRMVPIGDRAIAWTQKYLTEVRPTLISSRDDDGTMFLTYTGIGFSPDLLTRWVRQYVEAAGLQKAGACHLFRHTMATLMLERGADIRFVQEMLGHAHLQTTQIYTRVAIKKLKEIHSATHPSAKLERSIAVADGEDAADAPRLDEHDDSEK